MELDLSYLQDLEPSQAEKEAQAEAYYSGGILGPMAESAVSKNNKLYNDMKSGVWSQTLNEGGSLQTRIGGNGDGKLHFEWTQDNVEDIKAECKMLREMYQEHSKDGQGTDNPFFPGAYPAMNLPKCIANAIAMQHFNGRPWELIKMVPEDKWRFYNIVNHYHSDFVIHPSGKIPIPDKYRGNIIKA